MPKKARKRQYAPETRSRFAIEALDEVEVVGPNGSTTILDTNAMLAELERQGKSQNTAVLTGRHGGHKGRISGSEPNFAYEAHKMNNQFYGGKFTVIDIGELLKKPYQTAVNEMASKIQGKSTIFKDWCGARKAQTMSQSRYFRCRLNQVFSDALRKNKSQ